MNGENLWSPAPQPKDDDDDIAKIVMLQILFFPLMRHPITICTLKSYFFLTSDTPFKLKIDARTFDSDIAKSM